jgi:hypothetical protein
MNHSPWRLLLILAALFSNSLSVALGVGELPSPSLLATSPPVAAIPSVDPAREARLAWWREARFGMFIHWGVYSALAGEWKGEPVKGYSEHIMRIAKIPRQTYLDEVVRPFNPKDFNAEEWVRRAKETGMQYIIITAMHHDGVAMFDSKVDDYNVSCSSLAAHKLLPQTASI